MLADLPDWPGRIVIGGTNPVLLSAPESPEAKDLTNSLAAYGNKAVDLGDTYSSSIIRDLVPGSRGLVGGIVILLAYGYLLKWAMCRGFEASSTFARLTAIGLAFTLFLYVSLNMAMVMGLAPVVRIPLPLLSYGGSAMMTVLILLGILMSIHRQESAASCSLAQSGAWFWYVCTVLPVSRRRTTTTPDSIDSA